MHRLLSGNNLVQFVGIVAGIFTAASMLPQLIKTFKKKQADEISLIMLIILMTGISMWIWYGVLKHDLPIIFTNSFSLLLNLMLMFFRWKYKNKEPYSSPGI